MSLSNNNRVFFNEYLHMKCSERLRCALMGLEVIVVHFNSTEYNINKHINNLLVEKMTINRL